MAWRSVGRVVDEWLDSFEDREMDMAEQGIRYPVDAFKRAKDDGSLLEAVKELDRFLVFTRQSPWADRGVWMTFMVPLFQELEPSLHGDFRALWLAMDSYVTYRASAKDDPVDAGSWPFRA